MHSNHNLQELNTFGLSCIARQFITIRSHTELLKFLEKYKSSNDPLLILGGGSNILFTKDYNGIVLKNEIKGIDIIQENDNEIWVKVGAGEIWHDFVLYCVTKNWAGIENLSLIPGTVGASPIQNIGAYGVEAKDVIQEVNAINITDSVKRNFLAEDCQFGYRDSIFKKELKNQLIITSVVFKFQKNPDINISYGAIQSVLDDKGVRNPTIKDISDTIIRIRQSKLPDPKKIGNAGSFFKNPVISTSLYKKLQIKHSSIPGYPLDDEQIKVPAGWLIEQAGWKGKTIGSIGVHKHQALVLVNYGNGNGNEIKKLAYMIKDDVFEKFGINISLEVNVL